MKWHVTVVSVDGARADFDQVVKFRGNEGRFVVFDENNQPLQGGDFPIEQVLVVEAKPLAAGPAGE